MFGFAAAVVCVEEIDRVFEKIPVCGADVVVEFGVFGHGLLVGLVSARDHREIGADLIGFVGPDIDFDQPAPLKGQLHRLIDLPAQGDLVLFFCPLQSGRRPVNGMGLGQSPFQRSKFIIHLLHVERVEFVLFAQDSGALRFVFGGGIDQRRVIGPAQHLIHLARPFCLEIPMGVIEVLTHLVMEEPRQLAVDHGFVRVVFEPLVAQQLDAALDPLPAVARVAEFD